VSLPHHLFHSLSSLQPDLSSFKKVSWGKMFPHGTLKSEENVLLPEYFMFWGLRKHWYCMFESLFNDLAIKTI
jgi:hypothetical protein